MKIAISGATGFIGTHLSDYLTEQGHEVIRLGKEWFQEKAIGKLIETVAKAEVIINLAGAPINRRWTSEYKRVLQESRTIPTRMLVESINQSEQVQLFISASAVGYYPSEGCFDEYDTHKGNDFLSDLCDIWETEARRIKQSVRVVITRFGIVLSPDGGAFSELIRPIHLGIATGIGTGKQPFTWIDLVDLMRGIDFIIRRTELEGVFNFVAPEHLTNTALTRALAHHYHTILKVKVPAPFFRLLYGEGAGFLTKGQCVEPTRLTEAGFQFGTLTIEDFLRKIPK